MEEISRIIRETIMITGFVMVMMLIIEFLNVQTHGQWSHSFKKGKWKQYLFAGFVGIIPGCLGPYLIVSLYTHNILTFGALITAFITTTGDESFVMLSLFPEKALIITGLLLTIGLLTGIIVDRFYKSKPIVLSGKHFEHDHPCENISFSFRTLITNLRNISFPRAILIAGHLFLIFGILAGWFSESSLHDHSGHGADCEHDHGSIDWIGISFALTTGIALFIVSIVPDHFLEHHLWGHIIKKHFPRIFLWTLGALAVISVIMHFVDLETWIQANRLPVILMAILIGLIPISGPHLIFVTLFAQGLLPFSVLFINSLMQDGHGSLPLIAESKISFIKVKLLKIVLAILIAIVSLIVS